MFQKIICLIFTGFFLGTVQAAELKNFNIFPDYLFTDEDLGVKFTVTVLSQGAENPKSITLIEVNEEKGFVKYRWPLNDEGTQGDEKAGDGVYSREIQFKEKRPKNLVFYVLEEKGAQKGVAAQSESLPSVSAHQRSILEIRAHPTFIDILKNAWGKIREKFI